MKIERDNPATDTTGYKEWRENLLADPAMRQLSEAEGAKKDLWLQLVEARQQVGLSQDEVAKRMGVSQAQVARIEKAGYDAYTLNTLRHYVAALGDKFSLEVQIHQATPQLLGFGEGGEKR